MLRNRLPFLALPALFLLFVAGPSLVAYTADWLWYGEVGYRQVFITMLTSQARLFLIVMLASLAWLIPNLLVALRSVGDVRPVFTTREGVRLPLPGRQQLRTIALNVSVVLSLGVGFFASSEWLSWLAWR
ncbi:MAG: hypothetical protein FJW23_17680, partial [Acidimicrobiia bacterium]|nr:hypothetical protein [Acidimicrobiia bacterium]